jgi:hypothetical protein
MGSSGPGRVWDERGIYRQRNGKFAVCWRHAGRLRFRTVGFDVAEARRERLALIAATPEGKAPVSPRLRFETVAGQWLERFEAKVAAGRASSAHAGGAPPPARPPPATGARAASGRRANGRRRRRAAAPAAAHGLLGEDLSERARDAPERAALRAPLRLDRRRPGRAARARRAPPAAAPPPARPRPRRDRSACSAPARRATA